jgi:hypothetical protein
MGLLARNDPKGKRASVGGGHKMRSLKDIHSFWQAWPGRFVVGSESFRLPTHNQDGKKRTPTCRFADSGNAATSINKVAASAADHAGVIEIKTQTRRMIRM